MDSLGDAAARAAARASWPGRKSSLGASSGDEDLSATTSAEQRVAMVWELSERAWLLSGRPFPDYARSEMPIRRIRLGES